MKLNSSKVIAVIILAALVVGGLIFWPDKKITDPKDKNFKINEFLWDDYVTAKNLANVFQLIFPIGTRKAFIDEVLLNDPKTEIFDKKFISEYKKKTGGTLIGPIYDKILYKDPLFKTATYFVKYHRPFKHTFLSGFNSGSSRLTMAFYDENDRLVNMVVSIYIVHEYSGSKSIGQ